MQAVLTFGEASDQAGRRAGPGRARAAGQQVSARRVLQRPRRIGSCPSSSACRRCRVACRRRGGQRRSSPASRAACSAPVSVAAIQKADRARGGATARGWSASAAHRRRHRGRRHGTRRGAPAHSVSEGAGWLERAAEGRGAQSRAREGTAPAPSTSDLVLWPGKPGVAPAVAPPPLAGAELGSLHRRQDGVHDRLCAVPSTRRTRAERARAAAPRLRLDSRLAAGDRCASSCMA